MEKRSGVLVENEKHANKSVAKVMRITFRIFSVVFLLNVLGIFVVDMKTMTIAYVCVDLFCCGSRPLLLT